MATDYTINLVNSTLVPQTFWCFLAPPQELNTPAVFGNSTTFLIVNPNEQQNVNNFVVPLQYQVAAGASNNAVGLGTVIESFSTRNANLGDVWDATYNGPEEGPNLTLATPGSGGAIITIVDNTFNPGINQGQNWYANQSFGIQSSSGFIGLTWDPQPGQATVITPSFTFYVALGSYSASTLAEIDTYSTNSAAISLEDFASDNQVWVERQVDGSWSVTNTNPYPSSAKHVGEHQLA